mmetsp:Transcript_82910/g.239598  ORF Transcript_82910/g.239598 Transcript_82910/m.239598 type:complete len:265 (-) Transcript_82910:1322-2116(-)
MGRLRLDAQNLAVARGVVFCRLVLRDPAARHNPRRRDDLARQLPRRPAVRDRAPRSVARLALALRAVGDQLALRRLPPPWRLPQRAPGHRVGGHMGRAVGDLYLAPPRGQRPRRLRHASGLACWSLRCGSVAASGGECEDHGQLVAADARLALPPRFALLLLVGAPLGEDLCVARRFPRFGRRGGSAGPRHAGPRAHRRDQAVLVQHLLGGGRLGVAFVVVHGLLPLPCRHRRLVPSGLLGPRHLQHPHAQGEVRLGARHLQDP